MVGSAIEDFEEAFWSEQMKRKVTYVPGPTTMQELVINTMAERAMNDRQFANALTESIPSKELSHATVINWRKHGKQPETEFLEAMLAAYMPETWQHQFALKALAIKSPLMWGEDGLIWELCRNTASGISARSS